MTSDAAVVAMMPAADQVAYATERLMLSSTRENSTRLDTKRTSVSSEGPTAVKPFVYSRITSAATSSAIARARIT